MRILALDVGEKRIGVAKADSDTRIAVPVGYVTVDGSEWQEIAQIARLQGSLFFVVGLPRSNEGNETKQTMYVRNFVRNLTEKLPGARVRFQDESFTSVEAEERLKQRQKNYEKGDIDAEAAAIILQDFLENLKAENERAQRFIKNTESKSAVAEVRDIARERTKKEAAKVKLRTKKAKSKAGGVIKAVIILVVLGALAGGAVWGVNWYLDREEQKRAYAEYVAEKEAEQAEVFNFMIRPGETIREIRESLIEVGYSAEEVDKALETEYDFDFLRGRPEGATLEGYLFGETHEFYVNASATEVIETFLRGMEEMIDTNNLEARYAEQGLSLYEGITLASVVQKESPTPEMSTVAQVFLSRLAYGIPLGSDVTVSYALDTIDPDRETYSDNQAALKVDSCYNTRVYAGLPCGPISNPGREALLAVAEPSDSTYLYFLTGDDGLMYYSYTEYEHNQNARLHCSKLCNVSL